LVDQHDLAAGAAHQQRVSRCRANQPAAYNAYFHRTLSSVGKPTDAMWILISFTTKSDNRAANQDVRPAMSMASVDEARLCAVLAFGFGAHQPTRFVRFFLNTFFTTWRLHSDLNL